MDTVATAFVTFDKIARAAFAASGAYLVGSYVFRLLGSFVAGDSFDDLDKAA